MKKKPKSLNWERSLSIANLVLTAVIGIFVALYLKSRDESLALTLAQRNEEFQRQLIDIQAKAEFAQLEITEYCLNVLTCNGGFSIKNVGPATAKNIKLVVFVNKVYSPWADIVHDIGSFELKVDNPSLQVNINPVRVSTINGLDMSGNNGYEVSIDNLPPNSTGIFSVVLQNDNYVEVTFTKTFSVKYLIDLGGPGHYIIHHPMTKFLESKFPVAYFLVNASCDNCQGNNSGVYITVSSITNWNNSVLKQETINGLQLETFEIKIDTLTPRGIEFDPLDDFTNLEYRSDDFSPESYLVEIFNP